MTDQFDISIIYTDKKANESLARAIALCEERGSKCEIINNKESAKGLFITQGFQDIYYEIYYLHIQFVSLFYKDVRCNAFKFLNSIAYNKASDDFRIIKWNKKHCFYRRETGDVGSIFVEPVIYPACILSKKDFEENTDKLPENEVLELYREYFK
jgi:hypothetical protein